MVMKIEERTDEFHEWLEYEREHIVSFLSDILAIPSPSRQERKAIERIQKEMKKVGFDDVQIDRMGNIVGSIGKGSTVLLYDSHIDTVGVGDPDEWVTEPYAPVVKDGIIYGRGASDNKAAIVAMVYGAKLIKDLHLEDDYTLHVAGVLQEEDCDGLAVQYIIENDGITPDFVVLGECTDLHIYRGHRGRIELKIVTKGISGHASAPGRCENAIYKMAPVIQGIEELNDRLLTHPFLGKGSIAVTSIECRTPSINAIPAECTIYLDRRLTIGESKASALKELHALEGLKDAGIEVLTYSDASYTGMIMETEKYFPSWVLPEDHVLIKTGRELTRVLYGKAAGTGKWTFSTDGITTMGRLDIPTIGFGPGKEDHAHTARDQVAISQVLHATEFYGVFPSYLVRKLKGYERVSVRGESDRQDDTPQLTIDL
jgi:putative selenium metabolism hydrolase